MSLYNNDIWQRLIGHDVTAGHTYVYSQFGAVGELIAVGVVNLAFGFSRKRIK